MQVSASAPFRRAITWFFLGSFALSAAVLFDMALPLGVAAVLGYISEKPIDWVLRRIHRAHSLRWRQLVTGCFLLLAVLLVCLPMGFALYVAVHDLVLLIGRQDWDEILRFIERLGLIAGMLADKIGYELPPAEQLTSKVAEFLASHVGSVGGLLGSVLSTTLSATPQALFNGFVILLAWYVFALEGRAARDRVLPHLLPWPREREILRATTAEVIESVIIANMMVSAVQATICTVALLVLGVPRALVWGVLSFFLSFVPVVGTAPITLGGALYCFTSGRSGAALAMVIVAVVVATVDNFLRPLFMRSSADLSMLWLLVAFVGGVSLFGLSGIILGPLAFSLFLAFLAAIEAPLGSPLAATGAVAETGAGAAPDAGAGTKAGAGAGTES